MNEIKFNYAIPREYIDRDTNEINYCLPRGGEKMDVADISYIQTLADAKKPKNGQPWMQVFNNGYRVTTDTIDWSEWIGITFSDIDSKYYYDYKQPFDVNKLLDAIRKQAPFLFPYNYYGVYITGGGKSFRVLFYWKCKRTEENFLKCSLLNEKYTRDLFYFLGKQTAEIIDYDYNGHRVLDRCSKSILQGLYVTPNPIYLSEFINNDDFGYCELDEITIEDTYKVMNTIKFNHKNNQYGNNGISQHDTVKFTDRKNVDKSNLRYYPHHHRRCIYEALIVLFNERTKVDEEWKRIAALLPETDNITGGHDTEFYMKEPSKNKWYERFNDNEFHDIGWLNNFGYEYTDKAEYIYKEQFEKSWKGYCIFSVKKMHVDKLVAEFKENNPKLKAGDIEEYAKKQFSKLPSNIFDEFYNNNLDEDDKDKLDRFRREYRKNRWDAKDFKYLCNGYDIGVDLVTYKMYADFYYRDNNNLPLIKYNVLEDEVVTYGYWPETNKMQWHPFKYGDEYTHWKNIDTFSQKTKKEDLLCAVTKYAPRWHAYHSIKDYLNSLDLTTADEELLETWAIRYFKADDNKLTRTISKNFFIGAVKKMMIDDPTKFVFQHMLFLQGPTGCGKTFFLINMFTIDGHSYILNKIDPNGKDNEIGPLIGKNWLIQFGESENLKKVSINAAKEFMDRINLGFKYQKKYENEQTTIYPRIVACRTSNDDVLFNDMSVNEGDRRNWLIVCKCEASCCDENMRDLMKKERDILWATAMKLYLDNPDADLELSIDLFKELNALQEDYKMIKSDDIKELYDEIFERKYLTDNKKCIQDEYKFNEMIKRSDSCLHMFISGPNYSAINTGDVIEDAGMMMAASDKSYIHENTITRIPVKWISSYVRTRYGKNHYKGLTDYLKSIGWESKPMKYNGLLCRCWTNEKIE